MIISKNKSTINSYYVSSSKVDLSVGLTIVQINYLFNKVNKYKN